MTSEYLQGVPCLPQRLRERLDVERPSPRIEQEADAEIGRLKQLIRQRREAHERTHGPIIVEPPYGFYE